ncbi:permease-like cell division protein FtsX [Dactylosporangium sp. CA-152071]|uniref:permease-like cell division protein FtsX n=1 Tax=Dactylosporangium sp. CA-152071 TaxID=3239933 RepID=UPI003D8D2C18
MNQQLHDALHAEYELAHDTIRPDGVAAVHAGAARRRRRHMATGAAILALAVAGAGAVTWRLLPGDGPAQMAAGPGCDRPGHNVAVFLKSDVTEEQTQQLDLALRSSPEVYCLSFETKEQAWEQFKIHFSDAPDLVAATRVDMLPQAFRFRVAKVREADAVEQRIHGLQGYMDYVCSCRTATPTKPR